MAEDHTLTLFNYYCERAGQMGFWAEPLNAITNLAFIIAAGFALGKLLSLPQRSVKEVGDIWLLCLLLFAIGVGSFLWHTVPKQWTLLADVLPIVVFINLYLFSLFRRVMKWDWWQVVIVWVAFHVINQGLSLLPETEFSGSLLYAPAIIILFFAMAVAVFNKLPFARSLFITTAIFFVSLTLRTVDLAACSKWGIGTHFFWHVLNAIVTYRLLVLLVETKRYQESK